MTLTRCNNGHFYDEDKFSQCPHCESAGRNSGATIAMSRNDNVTVGLSQEIPDVTVAGGGAASGTALGKIVQETYDGGAAPGGNDSVTVSYYNRSIGTAIGVEPVVGWLVCIEGNHLGEGFQLKAGRNFIGRSTGMDVVLSGDSTVSRDRHAIILYDPENNKFLVQPGDARELCYLNNKLVLSTTDIVVNDIIKVGETKLMFVPFCSDVFNWSMVEKDDETGR